MSRLDQFAYKGAATVAILGGLAWIAYTLTAMLQPWGSYATYVDTRGVAAMTNVRALQLTAALGGAALLLLGAALAGAARRIGLPNRMPGQIGIALGVVGSATGLAVWTGALFMQMNLVTAAMNAGAIFIPVGAILVAIDGTGQNMATPLFIVGALGMAAVFAAALVSLVSWMLPVYAALAMAVYGFAWVRLGSMLASLK